MNSKIVSYVYLIIGLVNLSGHLLHLPEMARMSKVMLMPCLLYWVYVSAEGHITLERLLLSLGLVFAWFGDIALVYSDEQFYFLLGLGLFLICQLIYAVMFWKARNGGYSRSWHKLSILAVFLGICLWFILPDAGELMIPVAVYAICLTSMVLFAWLRAGHTESKSYSLALVGSALFLVSDALIGVNKFVAPLMLPHFWIMGTYTAAQLLIAKGVMAHSAR